MPDRSRAPRRALPPAILALALSATTAAAEGPPLPPERPAEFATPLAPAPAERPAMPVPPPAPPERPPELSGAGALALKVAPPDDAACRVRLRRLGATFEPLAPIADGQCGAPLPLRVVALADGVALPQGVTVTCRMAEALARWASEVQVEAERRLERPLTALETGGSYVCRGQDHDPEAKLSEHAFADAVDVTGFALKGRPAVPVRAGADAQEAAFLDAARAKACGFFRTVLGPGTDAAHATHFHLDERERAGGHRLCQ